MSCYCFIKLIKPLLASELMYARRGFYVLAAKCCFDWEVLVAVWCVTWWQSESDAVSFYLALWGCVFIEQSFSREQPVQKSARTSAFIFAETETHWLRMNFSDEHRLGFSRLLCGVELHFLLCRCFYSFIWFFVVLLCLLVVVTLKNKKQHWARKSFCGFKMFCCSVRWTTRFPAA